jgi:integrase
MPKKKKTRRARGSGSIFFHEARQRWVGRVRVGTKPNGKPLYRECWGATQGEVVKRMAAAQPPGPDTTVRQWAERWLTTLTNRVQTAVSYRDRLLHILPVLGGLRVAAVTSADVEQLAANLLKTHAKSTVAAVLNVANTMFRAAVRARLIPTNPVADARRPRVPRVRREVYTPADLARVVAAWEWYAGAGPAALMAATGCRQGEVIGLDVQDFDPEAGTLSISRTYISSLGTVGPPKSENGVRVIRVPALALPVLVAAAGKRKSGVLFPTSSGRRMRPTTVDRGVRCVLRDLGLEVRGSHSLRHSVASALVAAAVPIADVAKFLGDTVATIVKTYLHPAGTDVAAAMERLLGGGK